MKKKIIDKKGVLSLYVVFIISAVFILLIAVVIAPLGANINAEFYAVGEDLLKDANVTYQKIDNLQVRSAVENSTADALDNTQFQIEFNNSVFQYSYLIFIFLLGTIVFLGARQLKEVGGFV